MAATFRIEMLRALHGDCLFVEWGEASRPRRMLIDGGPIGAWDRLESRLAAMPAGDRRFELIVMTHVDTDHVEGLIRLFASDPLPVKAIDVWFNGWRHLEEAHGLLGGKQGEFLSALLARRLRSDQWNAAFHARAALVEDGKPLPVHELEGGMRLTLLSPTPRSLDALKMDWKSKLWAGFEPGDLDGAWKLLARERKYVPKSGLLGSTPGLEKMLDAQLRQVDQSKANGSAIAFLAEQAGKSCLFLADAHHQVVVESLKRLLEERGVARLQVDAVKVSHHGSQNNTSDDLLALIESPRFLFSTNGDIFGHPDELAVKRIIARSVHQPPALFFNYRSDTTRGWESPDLQKELGYQAVFNESADGPLVVEI